MIWYFLFWWLCIATLGGLAIAYLVHLNKLDSGEE